ncbi:biotin transporter BioY [Inquilinus sp. OTU3971]|uniref:biotin transporter BioY n=1 Tax=Inquilinus sp. OTU3971 TaxID=3043855 RepID=UPI00313D1617
MSNAVALTNESLLGRSARTVPLILAGVLMMTLSAKVQIPFWPVPMTLHTLAVMAFAITFGPRLTVSVFLAYLAAGTVGLPVFSGSPARGIGLAYMAGPTGGYLLGYLVACWLVGKLAQGRGALGRTAAMLLGLLPIYGLGVAWLATHIPSDQLIAFGVAPFILGDVFKIGIVTFGSVLVPKVLHRLQGSRQ